MTQLLLCDLNLEVVLTQLEESSELVIAWFQNNYMKLKLTSVIFLWLDINLNTLWQNYLESQ